VRAALQLHQCGNLLQRGSDRKFIEFLVLLTHVQMFLLFSVAFQGSIVKPRGHEHLNTAAELQTSHSPQAFSLGITATCDLGTVSTVCPPLGELWSLRDKLRNR